MRKCYEMAMEALKVMFVMIAMVMAMRVFSAQVWRRLSHLYKTSLCASSHPSSRPTEFLGSLLGVYLTTLLRL